MSLTSTMYLEEAGPKASLSYRIANLLSYTVNPLVLPPLLFGLVLAHFGASAGEIGRIVLLSLLFLCIVPLVYLVRMVRNNQVSSLEVRNQARRTRPYLVGIAAHLACVTALAMVDFTAATFILVLTVCNAVNTLLLLLINLRWKISVHMVGAAGFVSVLLFVAHATWPATSVVQDALLRPGPLYGLLLLVVVLMWARVRVGAHTRGQVLGGTAFGLFVIYAELYGLMRAGLLGL